MYILLFVYFFVFMYVLLLVVCVYSLSPKIFGLKKNKGLQLGIQESKSSIWCYMVTIYNSY